MGAETFVTHSSGATAAEAFKKAVNQALYDHGHSGYTGTIGEKLGFIELPPPENVADMSVQDLYNWCYERINEVIHITGVADRPVWDDKWGPAACIHGNDDDYFFFGWASS